MAIDNTNNVTIEELKTIIHGLKMSTLSFIEYGAIDEIKAMIQALPNPELLDKLSSTPLNIKHIQMDVGNIMRIMEIYGKRDIEFKTRYKSRTGLPPRYKVLDFKKEDKGEHMKAANTDIIKNIVKISSSIDEKGHGELSGRINKFASNLMNDRFDNDEYEKIAASLNDSKLEKEAQFWQGVKEVGKGLANWGKGVGQSAKEMYQVGKYKGVLAQIGKTVEQASTLLSNTLKQMQNDMKNMDPTRQQQMKQIMDQLNSFYQQEVQASKKINEMSQSMPQDSASTAQPQAQAQPQAPQQATPQAAQTPAQAIQAAPQGTNQPAASNTIGKPSPNVIREIQRGLGKGFTKQDLLAYVNSLP